MGAVPAVPGHGGGEGMCRAQAVCWLAEGPAEAGSSKLSVEAVDPECGRSAAAAPCLSSVLLPAWLAPLPGPCSAVRGSQCLSGCPQQTGPEAEGSMFGTTS